MPSSMTRLLALVVAALLAAPNAMAQQADSIRTDTVAPGVVHTRFVRNAGPWVVHVLRVDLRRRDLTVRQVRAHDQLTSRERVSAMAARRTAAGESVLAAVNADFFDLATGASENNVLIDGEWWKGVRLTESPFDTFHNIHAQFAVDAGGRPLLDRFAFDGWARTARSSFPLITINTIPPGAQEGAALWTARYGAATPRDTVRPTSELTLAPAGARGDTLLYVRHGVAKGGGQAIPRDGAVLSAYGARAAALDSTAEGDTVRITLGIVPWPTTPRRAAGPALVIGGWPRILRDGTDIAARTAAEEGTISRNAEVRHPRTAVGFSRDSASLYLVTVDGRSAASVGMTLVELAALMRELGAWNALNFDGGGSTTMVIGGRVVNSPSDRTGEREVGNALLVIRRVEARP
jgi:hypothetical protein